MNDFSDQVVMVTGAIGNLGRAVSEAFRGAGARLVLVDRGEDRLREAFPALRDSPENFLANCADVTDPVAVEQVVSRTLERFGRIDTLVLAAGAYRGGTPLHQTPLEIWDSMLDLNARAIFVICQQVIPHMLRQRSGKIVTVSARAALYPEPNASAYNAAKSAAVRLTESMAAELKDSGINVNCILPGTIDTPANRQARPEADPNRWVTPKSLAEVILFLASDAARDIHGVALPVFGRS